ncbi:MAG: hypothetical protein ABRQ38_25780 [Candidatus Eremiobacterota bacterium]
MKIFKFLPVLFFISIVPLMAQTKFPSVYIDGQLFQGRVILYNNILYADCDDLMKAIKGTHVYNIAEKRHYINNRYFPDEYGYTYQNRFYVYLKYAVQFAGASKALYDGSTNTIIIEFSSSQTAVYSTPSPGKGEKVTNFNDVKAAEGGLTEHYQQNEQLDVILKEVSAGLYSKYGMQVPCALQVMSVDEEELLHIAHDEKLADAAIAGLYWRQKIYIQYGLSTSRIYEVMAHEFTHAWQQYNCPLDQEKLLIEGFAEWIAYKYSQGRTSGASFTNKGNTVYGKGLKFFQDMEKKLGETAIFDYVKKNKSAVPY